MLQIRKPVLSVLGLAVPILIVVGWFMLPARGAGKTASLFATVRRDTFVQSVTTAGELQAKRFVEIKGPVNAQAAGLYSLKIASIVPEGTWVQEGDIVAELDRAPIATKMTDVGLAMSKAQAMAEQNELDTTLTLATARDNSRNLKTALEEKKIAVEQSRYEPPAAQRQAQLEYDKALRALTQDSANYGTKVRQAEAKMREVRVDLTRQENLMQKVRDVEDEFTIKAPAQGMVIYFREYNGKKRQVGSTVNSYDPIIATLPDLTLMESLTYVNELDVRKLVVGLPVIVSLDADPGKKLKASVTAVANVGEQRPNVDAKVFEVLITLEVSDTSLRPGMTTSNEIQALRIPDALMIPLEAVVSEGETPHVYLRHGSRIVRQQIETGALNDVEIVVLRGLKEGDEVMLTPPSDPDRIETIPLPDSDADAARKELTPPPTLPGAAGAGSDKDSGSVDRQPAGGTPATNPGTDRNFPFN